MTTPEGWHSYHRTMARKPIPDESGDSKSQRTRARILDAAAHILSVKGYAGTRLADVADYAELQAPAIYYYFPSREDLIEEVMYCGISDMRRHLQQVLDQLPPETSSMDRIMAAVSAHLRHELELSDYARASIHNSGQVPEQLRTRQTKEATAYNRIWRGLISNALSDGQIREDLDLPVALALLLGALNWAVEWWDPRRSSVESMVANAQVFARHSLSPVARPVKQRGRRRPKSPAPR
jgi:AcrR family transcriptional regulator